MQAAQAMVKSLEAEGVQYVFGVPGEENLHLLDALRTSSIRFITTRHEQAAGFMAATVGRLTGKAGVALSTLGPGATNLVTAAAYAQLGAMPMMMITGQKPIRKSKQGAFQIIDTVEMMRPLTKYSRQLINGDAVPSSVREAFRLAEEERPGAVHLELPEDVAIDEVATKVIDPKRVRRPVAEEKAIAEAVRLIQEAKRPLLLIGAGANRKLTAKMLRAFVDKTGIPFFNTQMGKGVIDERHSLYLGTAALSSGDYLHQAVELADVIINVGHDAIEKPPFLMQPWKQTIIHVNFTPASVDPVYVPDHEVVGDIANAIWQLTERLDAHHGDFSQMFEARKRFDTANDAAKSDNAYPVKPRRLVAAVREAMASDSIVCLDNGMYKLWFARHYQAHEPNTLLLDNALATMGAGLPSAIAAALLHPDKQVLAVCGDGGFMMNSQELETAKRLGVHLVVLLLNDNGFGMIKWKQEGMGLENFGLEFGNPDFVKLAESYGVSGERLTETSVLTDSIKRAFEKSGVTLIEVPMDYADNVAVLINELKSLKN